MRVASTMRQESSRRTWAGRVVVSPSHGTYLGAVQDTGLHAHHAIQACVALEGEFRLRSAGGSWRSRRSAIIASDVAHQLDAASRRLLLVYVEPETVDGRVITAACGRNGITSMGRAQATRLRSLAVRAIANDGDEAAAVLHRRVLEVLRGRPFRLRTIDPRIARIVDELRRDASAPANVRDLARSAGLSADRFRHLFRREMGINYRRFLLWMRLYLAVRELSAAASLTTAAHAAGFADSAHFSRSFRRMFGIAPSAIRGAVRFLAAGQLD